jgi:hypothetical protein
MKISFSQWLKLDEEGGNAMQGFANALAPFIADNVSKAMGPKVQAMVQQATNDSATKTVKDMSQKINTELQRQIQPLANQIKTAATQQGAKKDTVQPGKAYSPANEQKPATTQTSQVNTPNPGDKNSAEKLTKKITQDVINQFAKKPFGQGVAPGTTGITTSSP